MRFLAIFLFTIFTIFAVLGGSIYFLTSGRLKLAQHRVTEDLQATIRLAQDGRHVDECRVGAGEKQLFDSDKSPLEAYQLRFEDETTYIIEAVCRQGFKKPIELSRSSLLHGVKKVSGSGIYVPFPYKNVSLNTEILFAHGDRQLKLSVIGDEISWQQVDEYDAFDIGVHAAQTTCTGWGLQCCSTYSEKGAGALQEGVTDCPTQCYSSCEQVPILRYFNANPVPDTKTREILSYDSSLLVDFSYAVSDLDGEISEVSLDFGDGRVLQQQPDSQKITHEYRCAQSECRYTVTLLARDDAGHTLAKNTRNVITVVMQP